MQEESINGFESMNSFKEIFWKMMEASHSEKNRPVVLNVDWLSTPLGPMIAVADEESLHLLEFGIRPDVIKKLKQLQLKKNATLVSGRTDPLELIDSELKLYFGGKLRDFKTPITWLGTPFQKSVWKQLQAIPYGTTSSYANLALAIDNPLAVRAVGRSNGLNQLAIVVPCHRVINVGGGLGGYAGGLERKQWLLKHERDASA